MRYLRKLKRLIDEIKLCHVKYGKFKALMIKYAMDRKISEFTLKSYCKEMYFLG